MIKRLALVALCAAFTVTVAGCSKSNDSNNDPVQTLHASIGASPQSLDPHQVAGVPALKVLAALCEPLLTPNLDTVQPEPAVAERWEISEDGLNYRFFIRNTAKWSDGSPLTAQDFVFTWQRILSPNIGHYYAMDFYAIKGAKAFNSGETTDFSTVGVKAIDNSTLEFQLIRQDPLFLKRMTSEQVCPVQPKTILAHAAIDDPVSKWTQPPNMVSNGPFKLVRWELNKILELDKNTYYWDADNVKLEKMYLYPIEDSATEERMFRSGQLQITLGGKIIEQKIPYYQQNKPDLLTIEPHYATYFYIFNTQQPPFDNVLIRRALAYAIDRDKIVSSILKSGQKPTTKLSPQTPGYQAHNSVSFDPERAKALLAEAGYPNGEGFPETTLTYNTLEDHRKIATAIQQMWKKYLNINVSLENQEWKVFLSNRKQHNFQVARAGSSSSFADPLDFLSSYVTGHAMNDTGWSNMEFDGLIDNALHEINTEKRFRILENAEDILLDEVPLVPIYTYVTSYLKTPSVKGIKFNLIDQPSYKTMYIDPEAK